MTRIAKLHEKLMARRPLSFAEFIRLIEAFGYHHVRTTGSHRVYRHVGIGDSRIVQPHGKAAKSYQVDQFVAMIDKHGLMLSE